MTERGTVLKCKNNFAQVRIGRNSACANCGKCGMSENQKHVDFYVENTQNAAVGDVVELEIPDINIAPLALVIYVLPLIPALALMFLGIGLSLPEWASVLLFFAGLALGFGVVVLMERLRKHKWAKMPVMTGVIRAREKTQNVDDIAAEQNTENVSAEQSSEIIAAQSTDGVVLKQNSETESSEQNATNSAQNADVVTEQNAANQTDDIQQKGEK